jgi:hypothetical protein
VKNTTLSRYFRSESFFHKGLRCFLLRFIPIHPSSLPLAWLPHSARSSLRHSSPLSTSSLPMAQRGSEDSPGYRAGGFPHSSQATSCRTFEFSRVSFWYLCHAHSFPGLFEYISALLTLPNRGRFTKRNVPGIHRILGTFLLSNHSCAYTHVTVAEIKHGSNTQSRLTFARGGAAPGEANRLTQRTLPLWNATPTPYDGWRVRPTQ